MYDIKSNVKVNLHNEFTIASSTGEEYKAYNIVLNQAYLQIFKNGSLPIGIAVGTGTGTPEVTRTNLFAPYAAKAANIDVKATDTSTLEATLTVEVTPEEWKGVAVTEIGVGTSTSNGNIWTHALLTDKNGNPITLTKGQLERWIITAKVYFSVDIEATLNGVPAYIQTDKVGLMNYMMSIAYPVANTRYNGRVCSASLMSMAFSPKPFCKDIIPVHLPKTDTTNGMDDPYVNFTKPRKGRLFSVSSTFNESTFTVTLNCSVPTTENFGTSYAGSNEFPVSGITVVACASSYSSTNLAGTGNLMATTPLFYIPFKHINGANKYKIQNQSLGSGDGTNKKFDTTIYSTPEDITVKVDGNIIPKSEYDLVEIDEMLWSGDMTSEYYPSYHMRARIRPLTPGRYMYSPTMVAPIGSNSTMLGTIPTYCYGIFKINASRELELEKIVIIDLKLIRVMDDNTVYGYTKYHGLIGHVYSRDSSETVYFINPETGAIVCSMPGNTLTAMGIPMIGGSMSYELQSGLIGYSEDYSKMYTAQTVVTLENFKPVKAEMYCSDADNRVNTHSYNIRGKEADTSVNPPWRHVHTYGSGSSKYQMFRVLPDGTVERGGSTSGKEIIFPGPNVSAYFTAPNSMITFENKNTGAVIVTDIQATSQNVNSYEYDFQCSRYIASEDVYLITSYEKHARIVKLDWETLTYKHITIFKGLNRQLYLRDSITLKNNVLLDVITYSLDIRRYSIIFKTPPASGAAISYDAVPDAIAKTKEWAMSGTVTISLTSV